MRALDSPVHEVNGTLVSLRADMARKLAAIAVDGQQTATPVPGLSIYKLTRPNPPSSSFYGPSVALLLQGRKQVVVGDRVIIYGAEHCLLTSMDVPAVTQAIEASPDRPYVGLILELDLQLAREMIAELSLSRPPFPADRAGICKVPLSLVLLEAFDRLLRLLESPEDIGALANLCLREITYRLLVGCDGARLRELALGDAELDNTYRAITWLKKHYLKRIRMSQLAQIANMGESTLYRHFRSLTRMSPLQYQKNLKLHEARRLMLVEGVAAYSAAERVGYDSHAQFSREYKRLFGDAPRRDIKRLRSFDESFLSRA